MKNLIWIMAAVLIIAVIVCVLPLPSSVNKTVDGVWLRELAPEEPISISLNGTFYRYLVRNDKWKGTLKIPGVIEMKNDEKIELAVMRPVDGIYQASVFAYDRALNRFRVFGYLFFDKEMNTVVFDLEENIGGVIAAPATNADEARAVIDAMPFGGIGLGRPRLTY